MYELTLENIKNAIRVDHDFDDNEIQHLHLPAAKRQVKGAVTNDEGGYEETHTTIATPICEVSKTTITEFRNEDFYNSDEEIKALFNLAVLNTIGHNYENRSTTSQFERVEIARSSLAHIQALRGEYAKWKSANSSTE